MTEPHQSTTPLPLSPLAERGQGEGSSTHRRVPAFNSHGVWAIYRFQMARFFRTLGESLATPVITTALYFVVFGSAIGSRIDEVGGVQYGSFIVPGLIMLSL